MRRAELDFVRRRPQWPLWLAFGVAVVLAADAVHTYFGLQRGIRESSRPAELRPRAASDANLPEATRRELDAARRVLQDLVLPWGALFRSVEAAVGNQAALLSIEPDAARGQVRITGEARDYAAVIELMRRLESGGTLSGIHLISHEMRSDQPQRPVHFALVGYWRTGT